MTISLTIYIFFLFFPNSGSLLSKQPNSRMLSGMIDTWLVPRQVTFFSLLSYKFPSLPHSVLLSILSSIMLWSLKRKFIITELPPLPPKLYVFKFIGFNQREILNILFKFNILNLQDLFFKHTLEQCCSTFLSNLHTKE